MNNIEEPRKRYAHPIFWWSLKVVCGAVLIASLFLMVIYQLPVLFTVPTIVAQSLVFAGAFVSLWHYRILKKSTANMIAPTELITKQGLFRWLRHPMYLADMIAYTGLFMLMPNVFTVFVLLMAYVALFRQAQIEDAYMASLFVGEFDRWQASSRLLFPFIY